MLKKLLSRTAITAVIILVQIVWIVALLLRLSYTDGSGEHRFYISESGENGKPILADETIEAVG